MKKALLLFVFFNVILAAQAERYNIFELFSIDIPKEFEIKSINSRIACNKNSDQYWLSIYVDYLYEDLYLTLYIEVFGNEYHNEYNSAMNEEIIGNRKIAFLANGFDFYELISDWSSGYRYEILSNVVDENIRKSISPGNS